VFVRGDEGYDGARRTWNVTTFEQHPAMVVLPSNAAAVVAAVVFAREHALPIAVQGGGHGHPRPADGALLLNFADMAAVRVAPAADGRGGTARVEAGARWREVIAAAHAHGLAPLSGFAATVGVVGYSLGGGIGWMVRQHGAAAGSVRSAEVVTSDGRLLQVSERSHADLFWGLRGGGGNFGVVTALEFELYPVQDVFGGFVAYPLTQGREALTAYATWTKGAPDTLTSAVRLMHYPPAPQIPEPLRGASAVVIMACSTGSTPEAEALLKPLRSIGTPLVDTFRRMPFAEIGTIANDPPEAPPLFTTIDGGGLRDFSPDAIDNVLRIAGDRASGIFVVEARHLGGALERQPAGSMPFAFRSPWFLSALAAAPTPDVLQGGKRSIGALLSALQPTLTGERLVNALDAGTASPELTRAAYTPEAYQKLVALKDRYDPHNVFRFNHNIGPSTDGGSPATLLKRPMAEPASVRSAVDAVIARAVSDKRIVGAVVLIARAGELVYEHAAGLADREAGTAMRVDTLFRLASVTKPIVCAAAMSLAERRELSLESRVDQWLPEFRPTLPSGESPAITVRHLLTHTAGLDYRFQQPPDGPYARAQVSDGNDQPGLSLQENLRRIASAPLVRAPGVAWQYSVAIDVLGAVMARSVGTSLPEIVAERITRPLGMNDTSFAVADVRRLAVPYVDAQPQPKRMSDGEVVPYMTGAGIIFAPSRALEPTSFASGGVGMVGGASDLMRFFETIRRGGRPVLSAGSTAQMMRNQNAKLPDEAQGPGPGWGFGFGGSVLVDPAAAGSPQSPGTWQWGGVYGHSWFVDPERDLTVIALTNTALEGLAGQFPIDLRDAIYRVI
jgi:CubicO group peptidase (beta-lactamase class C family)/UDP-N-acetylenolpyruvoylglucosamine reductase